MYHPKVFSFLGEAIYCIRVSTSMKMCDENVVGKKDVLSSSAGVKMSEMCESVTVNIDILQLCRQVGIRRTGTPTLYTNP